MIQHINFSTHSLGNTLDHMISPSNSYLIKNIESTLFFSDHALITYKLNLMKHHPAPMIAVRRCYSSVNYKLLEKDLFTLSLNLTPIEMHIDNFTHHLNKSFTNLLDQHAPIRSFKPRANCVYRFPIYYEATLYSIVSYQLLAQTAEWLLSKSKKKPGILSNPFSTSLLHTTSFSHLRK